MPIKTVAVFFGGRSPEHDVSVVSGLQILDAIDRTLYNPFPVYVSPTGEWYVGDALLQRGNYLLTPEILKNLTQVNLDSIQPFGGRLVEAQRSFLGTPKTYSFDIALPIFHGLSGEDGSFQGMMEFLNIPYGGMRAKACGIFMDKVTTKRALKGLGVAQLPFMTLDRPKEGLLVSEEMLKEALSEIGYPCCLKPANLGSSIGVGKADTLEEARSILASIFKQDHKAIIEPFLAKRDEYNVAVRKTKDGITVTSAIERPKSSEELLDFKEKYLSNSGTKGSKMPGNHNGKLGTKSGGPISEGMLSLTREINPILVPAVREKIEDWAKIAYDVFDACGAPRIDFMVDKKTNQVWFNELNPIPGSYGYFLWEASTTEPLLFTDFLTELLEEGFREHALRRLPKDPVPEEARLLKRP